MRSPPPAHWLFDRRSRCYVLDTGFALADGVAWAGSCSEGAASGPGAALFTFHGGFVAFLSGSFVRGAVDGSVRISFPNGGEFEGKARLGTLVGKGTISFAREDERSTSAEASAGKPHDPGSFLPDVGGSPPAAGIASEAAPVTSRKADARLSLSELVVPPIPVRQSEIHAIDVPASQGALLPPTQATNAALRPVASNCLSVEGDGARVGFRNRCDHRIRFSYCVAHSARPDIDSCETGTESGEVRAQSFTGLFDAFGQPDYDVRWIACDADGAASIPRLVRSDPPTGRCLLPTMADRR